MQMARPALVWWVLIVPAMAFLAILAASPALAAQWQSLSRTPFSHAAYQWLWWLAVLAHVAEAAYALSLAGRSAEAPLRKQWALQTLILGFPSLLLLRARTAGQQTTRAAGR